jgi:hypothetical protein
MSVDPIREAQRRAVAQRRIGQNARCACGELRPEALIRKGDAISCARCNRLRNGQSPIDSHHVAGRANSPVTLRVPVNDHRAILSVSQQDWPNLTLENPNGSPLLRGAACIRGVADVIVYLIRELLLWVAEMLELLDAFLLRQSGPAWWLDTEVEQFAGRN